MSSRRLARALEGLLHVAGATPESKAALRDLSAEDRSAFVREVRMHGLSGLVMERLLEAGDGAGWDALIQELDPGRRRAMAVGLRLQRACREAMSILEEAGVQPVAPMKGVALHACLYGSAGARNATDVDLLIPPDMAPRAHAALVDAGHGHVIKDPSRPAAMRANYENSYLSPSGVLIDVHVGLAQSERVDLDAAAMLERAAVDPRLADWGASLVQLDAEDTLLILAVHLAQDAYQGPFRQLVELAWWWERRRPDLEVAAARAERAGASTALWAGLWLARARCGAAVSDADLAELEPSALRRRWLLWLGGDEPVTPIPRWKGSRWIQIATLYPVMDGFGRRILFTWRYLTCRVRDWAGLVFDV